MIYQVGPIKFGVGFESQGHHRLTRWHWGYEGIASDGRVFGEYWRRAIGVSIVTPFLSRDRIFSGNGLRYTVCFSVVYGRRRYTAAEFLATAS